MQGVQAIVLDEWHELMGTKRGSLLELTLARFRAAAATAHLPHHEQVRAVIPAVDRFGAAGGLVTSTLKVRRREVEKAFAAEIDRTYAELRRRRRPTA